MVGAIRPLNAPVFPAVGGRDVRGNVDAVLRQIVSMRLGAQKPPKKKRERSFGKVLDVLTGDLERGNIG